MRASAPSRYPFSHAQTRRRRSSSDSRDEHGGARRTALDDVVCLRPDGREHRAVHRLDRRGRLGRGRRPGASDAATALRRRDDASLRGVPHGALLRLARDDALLGDAAGHLCRRRHVRIGASTKTVLVHGDCSQRFTTVLTALSTRSACSTAPARRASRPRVPRASGCRACGRRCGGGTRRSSG